MLKKIMMGLAVASFGMSSIAASATEVRPQAVNFQASSVSDGALPVAAQPRVAKKRELAGLGTGPLIIAFLAVGAAIFGIVKAVDNNNNQSSPQ